MTEEFTVQNIKCGGCVKAIQDGLVGQPGVSAVEVSIEGGHVRVSGDALTRSALSARLAELGFPESAE